LYKDSVLNIARAYLNACPPQSVFVSMGDNDFYPLLYIQYTEGMRKDVYVINYSLIGIDRFIYRISHPQFEAQPIRLSADTSTYVQNTNEIVYLKDSSTVIPASQFIQFIRTGEGDKDGRKTFTGGSIELPWKKDNISTKVAIDLSSKYLMKHQWILLDIINNLNGRVLSFPVKLEDELKGLSRYLSDCTKCILYSYNQ
jgi:hypothetical protein